MSTDNRILRNATMATLIANTKRNLENAQAQLQMESTGTCIQRCNTICCFPDTGLTIAPDAEKKPAITSALFATQFEPKTAKLIIENVKNGNGQSPVAMGPKEYYALQVELNSKTLQMLERMQDQAE